MVRIKVKIGDNNDATYRRETFVHICERDCEILQEFDRYEVLGDFSEYDSAWNRLCNTIAEQNKLPPDWFVAGINFD